MKNTLISSATVNGLLTTCTSLKILVVKTNGYTSEFEKS